ncbi:hypothetical protein CGJ17_22895 [Vibrio parahaemolyticus]|nr:hypothetical protein CGJ17_22895 [Vibrio parahaemolyticus]
MLNLVFVMSTQASEPVIQEKAIENSLHINNKPDIEDYDTLNYIGLDKARQQLNVFKDKSKIVYNKYIYKKMSIMVLVLEKALTISTTQNSVTKTPVVCLFLFMGGIGKARLRTLMLLSESCC